MIRLQGYKAAWLLAKKEHSHLDLTHNRLKRYLTFGSYPVARLPCIFRIISHCRPINSVDNAVLIFVAQTQDRSVIGTFIVYGRFQNWFFLDHVVWFAIFIYKNGIQLNLSSISLCEKISAPLIVFNCTPESAFFNLWCCFYAQHLCLFLEPYLRTNNVRSTWMQTDLGIPSIGLHNTL